MAGVVVAGIVAVEKVEELDEERQRPALVELDGTAHAQVGLNVWRAAELVESCLHAVDHGAIPGRCGQRDGPRGLRLRADGHVESPRSVTGSRYHRPVPPAFARRHL